MMQAADTEGWQQLRRSAPLRLARWLTIAGLVIWRWAAGTPSGTAQWWPIVFLAVVLVLPDMKGFTLLGSGIELREEAQAAAEEAKEGAAVAGQNAAFTAEVIRQLLAGQAIATVMAEVAEAGAETAPPVPASEIEGEFLG